MFQPPECSVAPADSRIDGTPA